MRFCNAFRFSGQRSFSRSFRSFSNWIGGLGVLVFILAILPMTGGSTINLLKAESPGPSVGKLVPKVGATARILYILYFVMTVMTIVLLLLGGMKPFDAFTIGFGTAGEGYVRFSGFCGEETAKTAAKRMQGSPLFFSWV